MYPDNYRVRYPVRIPKELYNDRGLDKVTILVMVSAFNGMNIPTLLNKLSADFNSNLLHEAYEDACKDHKLGKWTNKKWCEYSHDCLHYHMESELPCMGLARLEIEVTITDNNGNKRKEMTYLPNSDEENNKAHEELVELE